MFPTPNPRNGLILSPVRQVTILHLHRNALLAQWVARVTLNHKVRGSSPLQGWCLFFLLDNCFVTTLPLDCRLLICGRWFFDRIFSDTVPS